MKRMILGVVLLFTGGCWVQAEEVKLPEGYKIIESTLPYKMVLTPFTTYPVLLEKYVPVNLFEGKWGKKPGELGVAYVVGVNQVLPNGLVINSKNEIYILDTVNNRIQKISSDGKYIKSISVRSFCMKNGKMPMKIDGGDYQRSYYHGMDIVIDSKDHLYYYCAVGKEVENNKAEVWEFYDDVLIKKWNAPRKGFLTVSANGDVWIDRSYNVKKQREEKYVELPVALPGGEAVSINRIDHNSATIQFDNRLSKKKKTYLLKTKSGMWVSKRIKITLLNEIIVSYGETNGSGMLIVFSKTGDIISVAPTKFSLDYSPIDARGNLYSLDLGGDEKFQLFKYQRKRYE